MTYLEELQEKQRLVDEEKQEAIEAEGGTLLEKLAREQTKINRRGEDPEYPESYSEFASDQMKAAPKSAWGQVENMANAAWKPWETAKAVGGTVASGLQKMSRKYQESISGRKSEDRRGEEEFDVTMMGML